MSAEIEIAEVSRRITETNSLLERIAVALESLQEVGECLASDNSEKYRYRNLRPPTPKEARF